MYVFNYIVYIYIYICVFVYTFVGSKRNCCSCCLKDPENNKLERWIPTVITIIFLITVLAFCIQGLQFNQKLHNDLFDENSPSSATSEVNQVFDVALEFIDDALDDVFFIFNEATDLAVELSDVISTKATDLNVYIDNINNQLQYMKNEYSGLTLNTTTTNPFNSSEKFAVSLPCDFCNTLDTTINDINISINNGILSQIDEINNNFNISSLLEDQIILLKNLTDPVIDDINSSIIQEIIDVRTNVNDNIAVGRTYDNYRVSGGFVFYLVPIIWILFFSCGITFKVACKDDKCKRLSEWGFRCTWFLAMIIGSIVMFIFSPFALFTTLWADGCVRVDELEIKFGDSLLGSQILDIVRENGGENATMIVETAFQVTNACFTGDNVLDALNFSNFIDEFEETKNNLTGFLQLPDLTDLIDTSLIDTFAVEVNLLTDIEFYDEGDKALNNLNNVGPPCNCDFINNEFTRQKINNGECLNDTLWQTAFPNTTLIDECYTLFIIAFTTIEAENNLKPEIDNALNDIKNASNIIFQNMDNLYSFVVEAQLILNNVTCLIDPLYQNLLQLVSNYSNCGLLGDIYEGFKQITCVILFKDFYEISESMAIIAYFSIIIVIMAFMTQYVMHPVSSNPDENDEDKVHDLGRQLSRSWSKKALQNDNVRQFSSKHLPGLAVAVSGDQEILAQQIAMNNTNNQTEGGNDKTKEPGQLTPIEQPPPPNGPPPNNTQEIQMQPTGNTDNNKAQTDDVFV